MDKVTETAAPSIAYVAWMRSVVLANSQPGDKVLVVTHKKLLDHERTTRTAETSAVRVWVLNESEARQLCE